MTFELPRDCLTCLVFTHNRPHFLRRLLKFYSKVPPGFSFVVLDSSSPSAAAENLAAVESSRREFQIEYRHFNTNVWEKCARGLEQVETPFTVFCADDDLVFPDAVSRCVDFLLNKPDFVAAMGRTAMLNVRYPHWRKAIKACSIEHDRPLDRCRAMASNPFCTFFYAVYRTAALCENLRLTADYEGAMPKHNFGNAMLEQLSVLSGRIKVLPQMYSLREHHGANEGAKKPIAVWPEPERNYQLFKACLIDQLVRARASRAEAEQYVDETYGHMRDPNVKIRRPLRSAFEKVRRLVKGVTDRAADFVWTDETRHRRFVRSSDVKDCETTWGVATQLMMEFPHGIPLETSTLKWSA